LDKEAYGWIEKMGTLSQDQTTIPIPPMLLLPRALRYRIIRQLLMGVRKDLRRIGWDHVEASDTLISSKRPQGTLNLPRGIMVKKTYDTLVIGKESLFQPGHYRYVLKGPGRVDLKETNQTLLLTEMPRSKAADLGNGPETAYVNAEMVQFPLVVRNMRPGDKFIPLGMKGRKKLKNYFIDEKIPSETRRKTPLLVSGDAILWVCGYRLDERYKVTESTKRILRATIQESPPD
jgi:tRNA(Ile)-lysidine synthase